MFSIALVLLIYLKFISSELKLLNLAIDSPSLEAPSGPISLFLRQNHVVGIANRACVTMLLGRGFGGEQTIVGVV